MRHLALIIGLGFVLSSCTHFHKSNPCSTDDDCYTGSWCRPSQDEGSECVPFAGEGDRCEGYVASWTLERCGPGLICTDWPEPTHDIPGFCR